MEGENTWQGSLASCSPWGHERVEHDSVTEQQQSNPQFIKGSFEVGKWVNCLELRMHSVTWKFESQRNPPKQAYCSSVLQANRHWFSRNRWQSLFLSSYLEQDLLCWQVNWVKFSYWPPHLSSSVSPSAAQSLPDPSQFHMDYSILAFKALSEPELLRTFSPLHNLSNYPSPIRLIILLTAWKAIKARIWVIGQWEG